MPKLKLEMLLEQQDRCRSRLSYPIEVLKWLKLQSQINELVEQANEPVMESSAED